MLYSTISHIISRHIPTVYMYCIWTNWAFDRKMGTKKYLKLKHTQTTEIEGNLDREM